MGNKPSIAELPSEWEDILPNITRDDIIRSARKKCRVDDGQVYLDDEPFDLDDEHVPIALSILRAHPHLKDLRFKLVPGKLTEERYWAALFGILHDGGIEMAVADVVVAIDDDYETGDEASRGELPQSHLEHLDKGENDKPVRSPIEKLERAYYDNDDALECDADDSNTPDAYLEKIKEQKALIGRLQKSLREANHKTRSLALELQKERKKRHEEGVNEVEENGTKDHSGSVASCPRCNSSLTPERSHVGEWNMHPDCLEFMKLDDHLKENLRKEKEKRLNEVLSQMKFILDTDDVKDSYGSWSCCGKEDYGAECSE
mmetsp:Transcript_33176/g.56354  ORF Transcript_33176/g.56354 Transcript_33176/m.56354 type:complete len:317 (+) Transcript_33176:95-1045(+)